MSRASALVALLAFTAWLSGILPFIYWADSGELALGGFSLGLAHPPSFPLYALALKGAGFLPFGDIAFRASLLSVTCGAVAAGAMFGLTRRLLERPLRPATREEAQADAGSGRRLEPVPLAWLGAAAAVAVYAVSPQVWQVSVRQEVYTLHLLAAVAVIALVGQWALDRRPDRLLAAGFLFGLGLGNHSLLVLALFPPIALFLAARDIRAALNPRTLAWTIGAFALGLSVYLYLPLRSATQPFLDWNDPQRLSGFIESFTKKSERALFVGESGWLKNLGTFGAALVDAFTPWLVGLSALGIGPLFRRDPRLALLLLGLLAFNVTSVVMAPTYDWDNPDIPGYLLLTWGIVAVFLGEGLRRVVLGLTGKASASMQNGAAAAALLVVAGTAWTTGSSRLPDPADDRARRYGVMHLEAAPAGAVALTKSDPVTFLAWYLQQVEGRRPDVLTVNRKGLGDRYYTAGLAAREPWLFASPAAPPSLRSETRDPGGIALGEPDAVDHTPKLGPEIERLLAVALPRRPVLWESGRDNRWVLELSRPRGPWFEVGDRPVTLTAEDHRQNLAYQVRLIEALVPTSMPVDPRATRAAEVTLFNLANALTRNEAAAPVVVARAFGLVWRIRPESTAAGVNFAYWLFRARAYPAAEQAYRELLERGADEAAIWAGLSATLGEQGRIEEARQVVEAGLALHPGDPMLLGNLEAVRRMEGAR